MAGAFKAGLTTIWFLSAFLQQSKIDEREDMIGEGRFTLPRGSDRFIDGARIAIMVILIVVVAFMSARLLWLIIAPKEAVSSLTARPLPAPIQQTTRSNVRADLSLLVTTNPFQSERETAEVVPEAPETQLNLKLVALFMSTEAGAGSATIVTPDNRTGRFQPGDEILPGVQLTQILSDRVIITRDGVDETLMRGGRDAGLSVISDPEDAETDAATLSAPGSSADTIGRPRAGTVSSPASSKFAPGVTSRTLLASLDPVPQNEDGTITSFVLSPRGNPQLMQDAGLQPGDRLIEINRTRVSEIDPSALAAEFGSAQTVNVTVLRDGATQTFEIIFEEG
jgi:general secretion pathway protein C